MAQETPKISEKLCICLQFWDGDKAEAMKVAKLVADIEPEFNDRVDFMFAARHDCGHDKQTVEYVSRKFEVITHTSTRRGEGYPMGSNELWWDVVFRQAALRKAKRTAHYATLFFEADSAPMQLNWLQLLADGFRDAAAPAFFGHYLDSHSSPHVNGNCMVGADILPELVRLGGCSPTIGWDVAIAKHVRKWGFVDTPLIRSDWGRKTIEKPEVSALMDSGIALFHGVKDGSLARLARELLIAK